MIKFLTLLLVVSVLLSCRKNAEITPISATENSNNAFDFITPKNFTQAAFNFSENPLTKDKFQLGRHLFYDPILSLDSTISCNTCHAQTHGFADHNIPFSVGIKGLIGTRNAPPVFNLAWTPNTFMWDGGVDHLEKFPVFPITNPLEMGEQMNHVLIKLQRSTFYKKLFFNAYKDDVINEKRLFQFIFIVVAVSTLVVVNLFGAFSFLGLVFPLLARKMWFQKRDLAGEFFIGPVFNGFCLMLVDALCYFNPIFGAEVPVGLIVTGIGAVSLIVILWSGHKDSEIVAKPKK